MKLYSSYSAELNLVQCARQYYSKYRIIQFEKKNSELENVKKKLRIFFLCKTKKPTNHIQVPFLFRNEHKENHGIDKFFLLPVPYNVSNSLLYLDINRPVIEEREWERSSFHFDNVVKASQIIQYNEESWQEKTL